MDAFRFRVGAAMTGLVEGAMDSLVVAHRKALFIDDTMNLRTLEQCGAIVSADRLLALRDRVGRYHLIATLPSPAHAEALNQAWADGEALLEVLADLSRHVEAADLVPGLQQFAEGHT